MPVSDQETKVILNGTGSQLTFSFSFKVFKDTDISVRVVSADGVEATKTLGIDYTVTPSDDYELGGIVTFNTAPSANEKVLIIRSIPIIQDANFRPVSGFPEEVITDTFDQSRMIDQDLQEQLNRCVKVRPSSNISPEILGQEVERIYESIDNIDTVADNQAILNTVASNILDVNTVSDNMGSVNGVADKLAEITGVSQNLAEINILSDNIDDIGTVAMGIDNVNAVGSNIGDVMSVAANEGNINTVSDNLEAIRHCSDNINDIVNADDNAELSRLWAEGPELDLQNKTADPTAHSSKYHSEQSASSQIQADCAEMNNTSKAYINNKDLQYFSNGVTRYTNQDLSDLSEQGEAKFNAKANLSDVLLKTDKSTISGWGMPTGNHTDLALGAGSTYVAPANGYFYIEKQSTGANQYISMVGDMADGVVVGKNIIFSAGVANTLYLSCPARKGEQVTVNYNAEGALTRFGFYFAEGEV